MEKEKWLENVLKIEMTKKISQDIGERVRDVVKMHK
jgi:hypothetical protein